MHGLILCFLSRVTVCCACATFPQAEQGIRIGAEDLLGLEGAEAAAVAASAEAAGAGGAAAVPAAAKAATTTVAPSGPVGLTGGSEDADGDAPAVDASQVRWFADDDAAADDEVQL